MSAHPDAVAKAPGSDETIVLQDNFVPNGRALPTGNGWGWIAAAWSIFRRSAGLWIGITLFLAVIYGALLLWIIYGGGGFFAFAAAFLLLPIFVAGLMVFGRTIDQGGDPRFAQLFVGFKHRFWALLTLGVVYLVAKLVIVGAVFGLLGVDPATVDMNAPPEVLMMMAAKLSIGLLISLALIVPVVMAIWFAPALLAFHPLGPFRAMKLSFLGCLKNVLPFLLYGVVVIVIAAVASLPAFLGWLVLAPVLAASVYSAYRDIYFAP
jgi:hypothetical protein